MRQGMTVTMRDNPGFGDQIQLICTHSYEYLGPRRRVNCACDNLFGKAVDKKT